ncbi:MAG: hypothetical protein ACFB9M_18665 [Myxococcota bacterium]
MNRLESIDGKNWKDFLESPKAVLVIGKTDCAACQEWTDELSTFLEGGAAPEDVRFGKLLIDRPGLTDFKRANPWLKDVSVLPFTVLYQSGTQKKSFAGKGIDRLNNRLSRLD